MHTIQNKEPTCPGAATWVLGFRLMAEFFARVSSTNAVSGALGAIVLKQAFKGGGGNPAEAALYGAFSVFPAAAGWLISNVCHMPLSDAECLRFFGFQVSPQNEQRLIFMNRYLGVVPSSLSLRILLVEFGYQAKMGGAETSACFALGAAVVLLSWLLFLEHVFQGSKVEKYLTDNINQFWCYRNTGALNEKLLSVDGNSHQVESNGLGGNVSGIF